MRTKQIIKGLKNSQRFRVILNGIGFYTTVEEMSNMPFTEQRIAVWNAMQHVSDEKIVGFSYRTTLYNHKMEKVSYDVQVNLL